MRFTFPRPPQIAGHERLFGCRIAFDRPRNELRRLQAEGCSFADVLDETRRRLPDCHVRESVTLTEVAYLLGFSEPSAFSRAFQRWYGMSPTRYRADRAVPAKAESR